MAYDEALAKRIEELIKGKKGFESKKMFGGVGYLLNGNMCVGIHKNDLIVRFDGKQADELMKKEHVKPFDITGRPMKGWLLVKPAGLEGKQLDQWLKLAIDFAKKLPSKK